jgi:hypothetical protein
MAMLPQQLVHFPADADRGFRPDRVRKAVCQSTPLDDAFPECEVDANAHGSFHAPIAQNRNVSLAKPLQKRFIVETLRQTNPVIK